MTPLTAIWIASLAGALLFFAAGFLLARRHLGEAAAVDAAIPPRVPPPVVESSPPIAAADPAQLYATAATLRLQVGELRQALRDARAREQSYADVERELHRLRRERTDFEVTTRRELSFEVDVAVRQLGELERLRHENAALRRQLAAAGEKPPPAETDDSHQPGTVTITGNPIGTRPRMPRLASSPLGREQRSTSDQLSSLLARLRSRSVRAIALADDLGLPIVGIGDDNASLAAFASYVTDVGRKTREFLPLGPLRRVTVEDENDSTVTTCALAAGDAHLALITLTVGPGPSARQMGDVLRAAASMMR